MKVYLAGAASEIPRAKQWYRQLVAHRFEVVSTWIESVETVGASNPRDANKDQRYGWSIVDVAEVDKADVLWGLTPLHPNVTRGLWFELGYVFGRWTPGRVVVSGDNQQSIFTSLFHEVTTDEEALQWILRLRDQAEAA